MRARLVRRMLVPLLGISFLLLTVGAGGAWYVHRLQKDTSDLLALNVERMRAAEELELALRDVRIEANHFLITRKKMYLRAAADLRPTTDRWLGEAERLEEPGERERLARVRRKYEHFFGEVQRIGRITQEERVHEDVHTLVEEVMTKEILEPAHDYLEFNERRVAGTSAQNQRMADRMALGLLLLGVCGAVAGALAGFGLARAVSRSLIELSVPLRDAAGKLNEVIGPITFAAPWDFEALEVALRKMAEHIGTVIERLQQSQREALHAEQLAALGHLAAGMAHELRNPLMAMKILVQAGAEQRDAAGLRGRDLDVLEEEITRQEQLIQTFLDFARPPQLQRKVFELREVLDQEVHLVASRADLRGVSIARDLPKTPVLVEADMGQIRQLLLNLLLNALEAVPEGGTVWIHAWRQADRPDPPGLTPRSGPERWFTLQVIDNGRGLPAELGERIFEPFVSTKETGTGLGLSICKRIVEVHGGELTAVNRPGGGAVFTVRLPVVVPRNGNARENDRGRERDHPSPPLLKGSWPGPPAP